MKHENWVESIVFSPDGKYVATASWDKTARIWESASAQEIARCTHNGVVESIVFSPDGKYVATASKDKTARVWDANSGQEIARMKHNDEVRNVAFSSDKQYIATASGNKAQLWIWRKKDLIEAACARLPRNLTHEEWTLYLGDEPYCRTCPNLP